ncbi:MAG: hypothetical protein NDI75_02625 [Candidatus Didemnitutus sp.]|nr:hypothetical protein [Candidatus Didemnitutus sp.]
MIDEKTNPVPWSQLVYGLEDAQEHLKDLVGKMTADGSIDEEELRVSLGHIYAHLNRAWHSRDLHDEVSEQDWERLSRFPEDVTPVG